MRICPQPPIWNEVYNRLQAHASQHECIPSRPPIPLILNGWVYSNDTQKLQRWESTVYWAARNGCAELLWAIPEEAFYCVASPTTYKVGPMGGPMYRNWDFQPRTKPQDEMLAHLLKKLKGGWADIAGEDLAKITLPSRFSGTKARRLVVQAASSAIPPWGTWTELSSHEAKRRSFTRLRTNVNAIISPHEVDHIDFIPRK